MDLHRCLRGHWRIEGNLLRVMEPSGLAYHTIVPTPEWLAEFFAQVLAAANLRCALRFVVLDEAGSQGGFHTPGLVAVGRADIATLAHQILAANFHDASVLEMILAERRGARLPTKAEMLAVITRAVYRIVAMHEVGHAVDVDQGRLRHGIPAERFADKMAGRLAEWFRTPPTWEREALRLMGCTGDRCQHAPPLVRIADYDAGRQSMKLELAQTRREAEAQRLLASLFPPPKLHEGLFDTLFGP